MLSKLLIASLAAFTLTAGPAFAQLDRSRSRSSRLQIAQNHDQRVISEAVVNGRLMMDAGPDAAVASELQPHLDPR